MIRKHTEGLRPPRALCVPFELGRPFGAPNEPDFQRRVLLDVLKLLERNDGPFIADFPDAPPGGAASEEETEGWTCPVNLAAPQNDLSDIEQLAVDLKQEATLLKPWYDESLKLFKGRRLDGLTDFTPSEIIDHILTFVEDDKIESFIEGEPVGRALKLAADDLKHFYFQAAMARPGNISDVQLGNWFFGETLAGKLMIKLRELCLNHEAEPLRLMGRTNFVPHTMLKFV